MPAAWSTSTRRCCQLSPACIRTRRPWPWACRRMAARCITSRPCWTTAPSSRKEWCPCWPATRPTPWPSDCLRSSMRSIPVWRAGWPKAVCACCRTSAWRSMAYPSGFSSRCRRTAMSAPDRGRKDAGRVQRAAGKGGARPGRQGAVAPAGVPARIAVRVEQVQRVLGEVLQWQYPADAVLSHWLRAHPGLGARDRSELAEAVYDVLRHLRRYRQYAESGVGPASRRLALLGLAATLGADALGPALADEERQWLD